MRRIHMSVPVFTLPPRATAVQQRQFAEERPVLPHARVVRRELRRLQPHRASHDQVHLFPNLVFLADDVGRYRKVGLHHEAEPAHYEPLQPLHQRAVD